MEKINKLKNKYKGKRIFIIGNGQRLKNKDLILLGRFPHFNSFELPTKPHNNFIKTTQLLH